MSQRGKLPRRERIPIARVAATEEPSRYERFHARVRARETGLFYDVIWWSVVRPLLAICRVRAIDAHHVPAAGAVILAPNHTSYIDHFLVGGVSGRRLTFMAKSSLFDGGMRFVSRLGAFPVRRGTADEQSIQTALAVLGRCGSLVMYCEGTMSRDGLPRTRAKPGIGRLALLSGAPIVPVAILGAHRFGPLRLPRITVRFGEPLIFEPTVASTRAQDRQVADQVLAEITRLHGSLLEDGRELARQPATTTGACWPGRR